MMTSVPRHWWRALLKRGRAIDEQLAAAKELKAGDRVVQRDLLTRRSGRTGTLIRPARVGLYRGWLVHLDRPGRLNRSGTARIAASSLQRFDGPADWRAVVLASRAPGPPGHQVVARSTIGAQDQEGEGRQTSQ
jgi:hypothetical protein